MNLRYFNLIGTVLFVAAAWLQLDDGDPEVYVNPSIADVTIWVVFYGLVALLFALAAFGKFSRALMLFVAAYALLLLLRTIPGVVDNLRGGGFEMAQHSMSPERAHVELSREFFGALLALVAVGLVWRQAPKESRSSGK